MGWIGRWSAIVLLTACGADGENPFDGSESSSSSPTGGSDGGASGIGTSSVGSEGGSTDADENLFDVGTQDIGLPPWEPLSCGSLPEDGPTSVGCEFWAVRVPVQNGPTFPASFGIGVGNPYDQHVVVTIEDERGPGGSLRQIEQIELGPRESRLVTLNGPQSLLPDEDHTLAEEGHTEAAAFRISADEPITAMQINPVGGAASYVPEASMLLPTRALHDVYYGIGYAPYFSPIEWAAGKSWLTVVATEDGTTINSTEGEQSLDAFEAWTFAPDDATGFFVSANKRIAAFAGTTCSNIPVESGWCDHVEEQLIPVAAWGSHYVGARHPHRIPEHNPSAEQVHWRVIAAADGTEITLTPPVGGGTVLLEHAGDYADLNSTASFVAASDEDHPFMLVQYMTGGQEVLDVEACGGDDTPTGDPFMLQMVPTDQWLEQLAFLTDDSYARDFVTIVRSGDTQVDLACLGVVPEARFANIAGTEYEVANIYLDMDGAGGEGNCLDGQQFISASAPVGLAVGGFDCAASYGYPGGLSLNALWVPPHDPPG